MQCNKARRCHWTRPATTVVNLIGYTIGNKQGRSKSPSITNTVVETYGNGTRASCHVFARNLCAGHCPSKSLRDSYNSGESTRLLELQ